MIDTYTLLKYDKENCLPNMYYTLVSRNLNTWNTYTIDNQFQETQILNEIDNLSNGRGYWQQPCINEHVEIISISLQIRNWKEIKPMIHTIRDV